MAGYYGYSKSNNAIDAEEDGKFPVSIASKKSGIPAELILQHITPSEWHHTSSWYNETNYYDLSEIVEFFSTPSGKTLLAEFRQRKTTCEEHHDCKVEWLEWSGTRKNAKCEEKVALGAMVKIKGKTATITLKDGVTFQKRLSTNGFDYTPNWTEVEKKRLEAQKAANKRLSAIIKRFKVFAKGHRFLSCNYFKFRDDANRDSQQVEFQSITHKEIIDALKDSGEHYALRSVERFESGERRVVRVGLHWGVRIK